MRYHFAHALLRDLAVTSAGLAIPMWISGSFALLVGATVTGLGIFALFVLLHECTHGLAGSRVTNRLLGELLGAATLHPFRAFSLLHAQHHRHLNHTRLDPTWAPWTIAEYRRRPLLHRAAYRFVRTFGFWSGTIFNLVLYHFSLANFPPRRRADVLVSIAACLLGGATLLVVLTALGGIRVTLTYLLGLWVFHAIYSTITFLHHTVPDDRCNWSQDHHQDARIATFDIELPRFISFLIHNINLHVAHHIAPCTPFHALTPADDSRRVSVWSLARVLLRCNLIDEASGRFVSFQSSGEQA